MRWGNFFLSRLNKRLQIQNLDMNLLVKQKVDGVNGNCKRRTLCFACSVGCKRINTDAGSMAAIMAGFYDIWVGPRYRMLEWGCVLSGGITNSRHVAKASKYPWKISGVTWPTSVTVFSHHCKTDSQHLLYQTRTYPAPVFPLVLLGNNSILKRWRDKKKPFTRPLMIRRNKLLSGLILYSTIDHLGPEIN